MQREERPKRSTQIKNAKGNVGCFEQRGRQEEGTAIASVAGIP